MKSPRIAWGTKAYISIKIILLWKNIIKEDCQKYMELIRPLLKKEIKVGMKTLLKNLQSPTLSAIISY